MSILFKLYFWHYLRYGSLPKLIKACEEEGDLESVEKLKLNLELLKKNPPRNPAEMAFRGHMMLHKAKRKCIKNSNPDNGYEEAARIAYVEEYITANMMSKDMAQETHLKLRKAFQGRWNLLIFAFRKEKHSIYVFQNEQAAIDYCKGFDVFNSKWLFWSSQGLPLTPEFTTDAKKGIFINSNGKYQLIPSENAHSPLLDILADAKTIHGTPPFNSIEGIRRHLTCN